MTTQSGTGVPFPLADSKAAWHRAQAASAASALLLLLLGCGLVVLYAQAPIFRAGIDVVTVDAVVVDATGMPIRGLRAADFTLSEDGKARPIVAFDAIELRVDRIAEPGEASWVRAAPRDVVTNKVEDRRLFMIVIDDAVMMPDARAIARAKKIGRDVVSRLGVYDQAAVAFTMSSKKSQPFTGDHARLEAAIDATTLGGKLRLTGEFPDAHYDVGSAWTLASAVETLRAAPQARKTLVFISGGASYKPEKLEPVLSSVGGTNPLSPGEGARRILNELNRLFAAATRAHVNVYAFDVNDFGTVQGVEGDGLMTSERNYLRTVADNTGGRATIANEDPAQGITQMFRESSVYYLLGFTSASGAPGRRRVEVRTTHPGATVLSRKAFDVATPTTATPRNASPLASSLSALLPVDRLPMRAAATALPGPTTGEALVAVALGINQPAESLDGAPERMTAQIDAYQTDGKFSGATKLDVQLKLRPEVSSRAQYELLAKLPLRPGRYQLRIAAHAPRLKVSGSVFVDLDVPDFGRKGVTVAPLVLSTSPAPTAAPANAFVGLLPVVPTSHRSFDPSDRVSILARIVQGGKTPLVPVTVATTVVDTRNQRVFERSDTIAPDARTTHRSADYAFELPMQALAVGDYLLTVKATTPDGTNEKTLRFSRR